MAARTLRGLRGRARRASAYIFVLGASLFVAVVGVSAIHIRRAQRAETESAANFASARIAAQAAVELGLQKIAADRNWRTTYGNGVWLALTNYGGLQVGIYAADPDDGDILDDDLDDVELTGVGASGDARYALRVRLHPEERPLDSLSKAIHTGGNSNVIALSTVTVSGAPIYTNETASVLGTLRGSLETKIFVGTSLLVTGTVTTGVTPLNLPRPSVVQAYISRATAIPYSSKITHIVLAPDANPYGAPNADGVYFLDTSGRNVEFDEVFVRGTLIVRSGAGTVLIDDQVSMASHRSDYAVLVVDGKLDLNLNSSSEPTMKPSDYGVTLPASFGGATSLPNEVRGLIHATGDVDLHATTAAAGVILCEGVMSAWTQPTFTYDDTLSNQLTFGYSEIDMRVTAGTWSRVEIPPGF